MFWQANWFACVRAVLELFYFASGVVIAAAAILALKQISLTKEIANKNARRESVKLAGELCKYYAETVVPKYVKATEEHTELKLGYLLVSAEPAFVIQDGKILHTKFSDRLTEGPSHKAGIATVNVLEAFAIPFAEAVADEVIGYRETGVSFCQAVRRFMPLIYELRRTNSGRFESIVKLYEIWNGRLFAEMSAPMLKAMQEAVKKGESGQIKPLDFD